MKLHVLSDLHIEFGDFEPPATDADVVILAGDIGVGMGGLRWVESRFQDRPVIYVPGNHEFYRHDLELIDELKEQAPPHIHVLNNDMAEIGGVRFLGCVLWTDFAINGEGKKQAAVQYARAKMNDFQIIQQHGQPFTPESSIALHQESRTWLGRRLAEPFEGRTVVVTHHMPSPRSIPSRFAGSPLTPAFVSDTEELIDAERLALWVHGHTHDPFDYELNGSRVLCNPRGYYDYELTEGFRPDLVVEV